jgi:hypothetical protein
MSNWVDTALPDTRTPYTHRSGTDRAGRGFGWREGLFRSAEQNSFHKL